MTHNDDIIIINTDDLTPSQPDTDADLYQRRADTYSVYDAPGTPKCSIFVQGYNRLDKTKYAVECVLKYTKDVDYELILVDNGSDDGTFEFFQSVEYEPKRILRVTKNIGSNFPYGHVSKIFKGKYLIWIPNDVYVTQGWLTNMLRCYESDPRVGFAVPVSSSVSNLQQVDLNFTDFDDMQRKAAAYNKSDPSKWEERLRLISVIVMFSRQVLDTVGTFDPAYVHDFSEDDFAARLRHSGYKLILLRDTWVCHDHDFRSGEGKDAAAYQKSLEDGRATFKTKYRGIDGWDDINNYEHNLLAPIDTMPLNAPQISALTVDPRCGTPALEIRNRLRKRGTTDVYSCAFTMQAMYYDSLRYAADDAQCDRMEFIQSYYAPGMFDIVALCEPLNIYNTPVTLLQSLCMFLAPGGLLLFKLRSTDNIHALMRAAGIGGSNDEDLPSALPMNDVLECLKIFGMRDAAVAKSEPLPMTANDAKNAELLLKRINKDARSGDVTRLLTKDYIMKAVRG